MITILGAGAYGTAIAHLIASNGNRVKLWCHEAQVYDSIAKNRVNDRYLPGVVLPDLIEPVKNIEESIAGSQWIFEAVPVKYMRSVFQNLKGHISPDQTIILLSKGIENSTLFLPSQIIDSIFGDQQKKIVIAGPSFAKEIVQKELTGVIIASADDSSVNELNQILSNDYFRLVQSHDLVGVQLCAALKNVIALGVGILDGLGCKDNTKALFITKAFQEMSVIVQALGGKQESLYDLAGLGDLILTCIGASSKNLSFGKKIGAGQSSQEIIAELGTAPEGVNTLESLIELKQKHTLTMPLSTIIHKIIMKNAQAKDLLISLRS